jgi:hypothetical protein
MLHKKQYSLDSRDPLDGLAHFCALQSCSLTAMSCKPLGVFGLRR